MAKDRKNPIAKGLVWVVLLLLIVGLAGFGATSFGGSTRVIATVGDTEIDVDRYARALQNELRALERQTGRRVTMAEARQAGIDTIILQRLIATAALEDEAAALGLSVGDAEVARTVQEMAAFQGIDGSFDREAYRFALDNAGLSVSELELLYADGLNEERIARPDVADAVLIRRLSREEAEQMLAIERSLETHGGLR